MLALRCRTFPGSYADLDCDASRSYVCGAVCGTDPLDVDLADEV